VLDVTISDSDFGTPRDLEKPWFVHNTRRVSLRNVRIAGKTYSKELST
jgi:hypothetical protein